MENVYGGARRGLSLVAKTANPKEQDAYQRYLKYCDRIDVSPLSRDDWRERIASLFSDYRPPTTAAAVE